jgi:hypothetical protein
MADRSKPMTRRSLLQAGAAATAASLLGGRLWSPAAAQAAVPGHLRRSAYRGLTGGAFRAGGTELRLLSVADLAGVATQPALADSEDAFALAFSGPLGAPLESGIQRFSHPELGSFDLFVTPVDQPDGDRRYEVVVDRSVGVAPEPPDPVTPAPDPGPAAAPEPAAAAQPSRRKRLPLLRRVALRRAGRGARAELVVRPGVRRVHVRLVRHGHTVATAARDVRDHRAALRFRGALPAGAYTLVVTATDRAGARVVKRRRVTLR